MNHQRPQQQQQQHSHNQLEMQRQLAVHQQSQPQRQQQNQQDRDHQHHQQQQSQNHPRQQQQQLTTRYDVDPPSSSSSTTSTSSSSSLHLHQRNHHVPQYPDVVVGGPPATGMLTDQQHSHHLYPQSSPSTMTNTSNPNSSKMKVVGAYGLQQKLGSGSFAVVYKGVLLSNSSYSNNAAGDKEIMTTTDYSSDMAEVVAIKAIDRNSDKLTPKVLSNLEKEISILRNYKHRNIVCLQDVQKTTNHFYLILEYCSGGDLQRLIRERATGRLSERLCRRLMLDLSSGLQFLHEYQLIHRDIKPQNLLLTGALPLDEVDDPSRTQELEDIRNQINYPSNQFVLKIADFGFARHLQTMSLAETLCGSPLYMAPEILSHQRYDEKADLWSVGTVLFEMIAGKPPFSGDNHIHLLQNIQKNAVRLPPGVRVSKECVALLRVLLNRNPSSRANFHEFLTTCNNFVALGCNSPSWTNKEVAIKNDTTTSPAIAHTSISDYPGVRISGHNSSAESLLTVGENTTNVKSPYHNIANPTSTNSHPSVSTASLQYQRQQPVVTPSFGPAAPPLPEQSPMTVSSSSSSSSYIPRTQRGGGSIALCPIGGCGDGTTNQLVQPTPEQTLSVLSSSKVYTIPEHSDYYHSPSKPTPGRQQQLQQEHSVHPQQVISDSNNKTLKLPPIRSESYGSSSQHSSDDFVMVEHGSSMLQATSNNNGASGNNKIYDNSRNYQYSSDAAIGSTQTKCSNNPTPTVGYTNTNSSTNYSAYYTAAPQDNTRYRLQQSPPSSPAGFTLFRKGINPVVQPGDYMIPPAKQRENTYRGMLSTSPGTGGALMGMLMGSRARPVPTVPNSGSGGGGGGLLLTSAGASEKRCNNVPADASTKHQLELQIKSATKMLAASEDVGRRAVCVAHLGDHRALQGIKAFMMLDSSSSSMISSHPMEGIERENQQHGFTNTDNHNNSIEDSNSSVLTSYRRQRSSISAADKTMSDTMEEMPFALQSESPPLISAGIPTRSTPSSSMIKGSSSSTLANARQLPVKPTADMVRSHFSEALLCYIKALDMLKGAFAATEKVSTDISELLATHAGKNNSGDGGIRNIYLPFFLSNDQINYLQKMKHRCEITKNWLGGQFNGVLERGDAANGEIRKFPAVASNTTAYADRKKDACSDDRDFPFAKDPAMLVAAVPNPPPATVIPVVHVASVEELIYNQSLALGREGAVKQLLGQNEQARSCFRSAGLLAETLLMDSNNIIGDDRVTLEGYVDAFATQISDLDMQILQQQQQQLQLQQQQQQHLVGNTSSSRFLYADSSRGVNSNSFIRSPQQSQRLLVSFCNNSNDGTGGGAAASAALALPLALDPTLATAAITHNMSTATNTTR